MKAGTWHRWFNKGTIALIPVSMSAIALLSDTAVIAQVTPDRTLGSEQSTVNRNVTINGRNGDRIEGGARRGANLFHSFEQFNVGNGQRLYFANPEGVFNIIGRVTGRGASNISGTLGVQGNANLFLMNPNGIVFGNNATLDLRGSFVGTTANRLQFGTQGFFGTNDPQTPPLLTINPSALLFNQARPGKIQTQSVADAGESLAGNPLLGLRVADGQNLLLIGGEVAIAGGLNALGGQLGLFAVKAPATVELSADSRPSLQQPVRQLSRSSRGNVLINGGALLNVRADHGGEIQINAEDIQIRENSILRAGIDQDLGNRDSQAGDIILNATGNIEISGSNVLNSLIGMGTSGDLVIRGRSLVLNEGAILSAATLSQGNAGRVVIQVAGSAVLTESATVFNTINPDAIGSTGGIFLEAGSLTMTDGAELVANTNSTGDVGNIIVRVRGDARLSGVNSQGDPSGILNVVRPGGIGNAGEIRLSAGSLSLTNGARLQTNTRGQGNAGNVIVRVRDRFLLDSEAAGIQDLTGIFTAVGTDGVGKGGAIDIQSGSLVVLNGAQLTANTFAQGDAGDITIQVREQAIFDGSNNNYQTADDRNEVVRSGVFSAVGERFTDGTIPAFGNGGDIRLSANQIKLRNGAALGTAVLSGSRGDAGSITITATDRVSVDGRSRNRDASSIRTQVNPGAVGNANGIQITTDRLTVSNEGLLQASIGGDGKAGNIRINSRILELFNGGRLLTTTAGSRPAGDIDLRVDDRITLSGQTSGLFASTERNATGRGGSINITTHQLAVSDRAAITVSSPAGRAGNLTIAANQIRLNQGRLTAEAGVGSGAEITLQGLDSLLLQNNSLISAQASDNATGGNVTVDAPNGFVVAVPEQNNDIIASADQGRGGNISITAQGIFSIGQQRSSPQNQTNDIDASSRFNQSGTVTINQPDIDPSQGLIELPTDVVDRSTQIARGCTPGSDESSRFVATGRGGLPISPDQPLRDRAIVSLGWVALDSERSDRQSIPLQATESQSQDERSLEQVDSSKSAVMEASEFSRDANGKVVLVAQAQTEEVVGEHVGDRVCLERSP
ncbi:MAG: S-layer family protein [Drouetiella hepatica Uher 2000/2452]|uniref:S-layer family protein n=1 Tax=Drouetiella hepatica Uher 2000/2452 TaxID=904376 RepID=A0A951US06_9CYAN|nr:S-layer family protein [Drouetiella hepatica Uher 2000/2452]